MRVFESLNCIVCKEPFARVANQPRSPRPLNCGLAMCSECFEKEKRELRKEKKNHQCGLFNCFDNLNVAYFLIDLLSQESALVFTPMGYLLVKPFKIPECPICLDEYSNEIEMKKSFALTCGHVICTQCYLKRRSFIKTTCPTCSMDTLSPLDKRKDQFHDFLNELPEMTRQIQMMDNPKMKVSMNAVMSYLKNSEDDCSCSECHKKGIIDEMFYCGECSFEICALCAYKRHHPHGATPLLEKQANQMLKGLKQEARNVIETYDDLVPELHKGLLESINIYETRLFSKVEALKDASTLVDLKEKHESFTKIKSSFESYAEDYLPHLRKFDAGVNQLIQTLNEFPDLKKSE